MIEEKEEGKLKEKIEFLNKYHINQRIEDEIKWIVNDYHFENIEITSRIKSFDSARFKLEQKKYKTIDELKDLIGVMIVCKNETQIYEITKVIEERLLVIQKKDYIKQSKMGYQSIHLKIQRDSKLFYEIQIKTEAMKKAQTVIHNKIYKNQKMPKILRDILTPIIFNSVLWYENINLVKKEKL